MMSKGEQADDDERTSNCCVSSNIIQRQNQNGRSDFATKRQVITMPHICQSSAIGGGRASDCDIKHQEMHMSVYIKAWFGEHYEWVRRDYSSRKEDSGA